ncbi:lycopene beta-cyclase CrtY [Sphingopyxis sp.]|uniref:lycopene beta-cyclase CrtY n=1 Tax=Sphingopyxis sp. TaxID=1908224 RepID=UPI0035AF0C35
MAVPEPVSCDIAIVGGGLAGGLAALALARRRPDLDVRLIEPGTVGGNHIWSFFGADVATRDRWLVEPLIRHHWDGYAVTFPAYRRDLAMPYNSITGEALAEAVAAVLPADRRIAQSAIRLEPQRVHFDDGTRLGARHVIDARGIGDLAGIDCGWQKFVGQALRIEGGHGLAQPTVMDATAEQIGGYRFFYALPFDAETVFVEDTYYSDDAALDIAAVRERIAAYATARGWTIVEIEREETGWLPVVVAGDFDALWPEADGVARIGVRAGRFHATTGYSLPDAVRTAAALPALVDRTDLAMVLRDQAAASWRRQRFYRMLGAMLFRAAAPNRRYRIFERFYRLSPGLIARFYAGASTARDKLRILSGKPPIPVGKALAALAKLDWR